MTLIAVLYVLLLPVIFLLGRPSIVSFTDRHRPLLDRSATALCMLVLALTFGGGLFACIGDRILFHDEVSVLAIAAAFHHGQPLYPAAQAPVEYALLYGPATYLLYLPPVLLEAMRLGVYQAWDMLALGFAALFIYLTAKRLLLSRQQALAAVTLFVLLLSPLMLSVWSIKADVWLLLFSACGVWAAVALPRWPAAALIALSGAVLVDLKLPLLLLALVPCLVLWQRDRNARIASLVAASLIAPLSLTPFALRGISLSGYLDQLHRAAGHGFSVHVLFIDLPYFLFLLTPTFALLWMSHRRNPQGVRTWTRENIPFLMLLAAVIVTALLIGSKRGAGPWHGFAIVVPLLFLNAQLWRLASTRSAQTKASATAAYPGIAFAAIMLLFSPLALLHAIRSHFRDAAPYTQVSTRDLERETLTILRHHPHQTLQMGVADLASYNLSFTRPLLQMSGQPLVFDPNARNEADLIESPVSPALMHALSTCSIDLWLIPKGGAPFSMPALYSRDGSIPPQPLYAESFQRTFLDHYTLLPDGNRYFDLWVCNGHGSN